MQNNPNISKSGAYPDAVSNVKMHTDTNFNRKDPSRSGIFLIIFPSQCEQNSAIINMSTFLQEIAGDHRILQEFDQSSDL